LFELEVRQRLGLLLGRVQNEQAQVVECLVRYRIKVLPNTIMTLSTTFTMESDIHDSNPN
jgi:hypothetical protein